MKFTILWAEAKRKKLTRFSSTGCRWEVADERSGELFPSKQVPVVLVRPRLGHSTINFRGLTSSLMHIVLRTRELISGYTSVFSCIICHGLYCLSGLTFKAPSWILGRSSNLSHQLVIS